MERIKCNLCEKDFKDEEGLAMHKSAKHSSSVIPVKKSEKSKFVIIIIIAVLVLAGFFYFRNINGNTTNGSEVQKITIGMDGNYYPNTISIKAGVPVEITLDGSVRGCYRNFNILELGVSKSSSSPSDTIKFTPDKKGTFGFRCSMGMGTGTIIVE